MHNCVYSRLETSGNPQFGQHVFKFTVEKVSLLTSTVGYIVPSHSIGPFEDRYVIGDMFEVVYKYVSFILLFP